MEFEKKLQTATAEGPDRVVPGAVIVANDAAGKLQYVTTAGTISAEPGAPAIKSDATFWLASCTKLMTTIAGSSCVEKGLFTLDEDVSRILPEWKDPEIITGFNEAGEPQLVKAKNTITLRKMLSHQSGLGYDLMDPNLMQLRALKGEDSKSLSFDIQDAYTMPLIFEPGEGWSYGCGIDLAGQMVERTNGNIRLGDYMTKNIWEPLSMKLTTFRLAENENVRANLTKMTAHVPDVGLVPNPPIPYPNPEPKDDEGDAGSYSAATDYIKVLSSLLANDEKLLKKETVEEMFTPQLKDNKYLKGKLAIPELAGMMLPGLPVDRDWNWGLGGILALDGVPGRGAPGVMFWTPKSILVHRSESRALRMYASQLVPPGDVQSAALYGEFQKELFGKSAKI